MNNFPAEILATIFKIIPWRFRCLRLVCSEWLAVAERNMLENIDSIPIQILSSNLIGRYEHRINETSIKMLIYQTWLTEEFIAEHFGMLRNSMHSDIDIKKFYKQPIPPHLLDERYVNQCHMHHQTPEYRLRWCRIWYDHLGNYYPLWLDDGCAEIIALNSRNKLRTVEGISIAMLRKIADRIDWTCISSCTHTELWEEFENYIIWDDTDGIENVSHDLLRKFSHRLDLTDGMPNHDIDYVANLYDLLDWTRIRYRNLPRSALDRFAHLIDWEKFVSQRDMWTVSPAFAMQHHNKITAHIPKVCADVSTIDHVIDKTHIERFTGVLSAEYLAQGSIAEHIKVSMPKY